MDRLTIVNWHPVRGCTPASLGCRYCVAANSAFRIVPDQLDAPRHWPTPSLVIVAPSSDLFHPDLSLDQIDGLVGAMERATHHTYLVQTRYQDRMVIYGGRRMIEARRPGGRPWPPPHVWFGVSVETQRTADERLPVLMSAPVAHRFVAVEPLLGPVDLLAYIGRARIIADSRPNGHRPAAIGWMIVGGERHGPPIRRLVDDQGDPHPAALDWVRSLRDQAARSDVPFLFRSWGGPPLPGRADLDGRTHRARPTLPTTAPPRQAALI